MSVASKLNTGIIIRGVRPGLRLRFRDCYIFSVAGKAFAIEHKHLRGPQHMALAECSDVLINVFAGTWYVPKTRGLEHHGALMQKIWAGDVTKLSSSPISWYEFKRELMAERQGD